MNRPTMRLGFSARHGFWIVMAALLGGAAFPPIGLWSLSLVSTALFLRLLRDRTSREALNLGIIYGVVYGLGTMYWFFGVFKPVMVIPLIGLMGAYFGLLAALIGLTRGRAPFVRAVLVGMFAVAIEWLRGDAWYLRFPWYTVPHALATWPPCVACVRWIGVYGLTFVIWLIAAWGACSRPAYWTAFLLLPLCALLLSPSGRADRKALLIQAEETVHLESLLSKVP